MRVFVTGASGWIGSAVVPELIGAGHQVVGLARSDASAAALEAAGARGPARHSRRSRRPASGAAAADGVIHLAFKHDFSGLRRAPPSRPPRRRDARRRAGGLRPAAGHRLRGARAARAGPAGDRTGRAGSRRTPGPRIANARRRRWPSPTAACARRSCGSPPTCTARATTASSPTLIGIARDKGVSGYIGDGSNRWPAVHRLDAARLFRLALEKAPAGSVLHGVADEGVPIRDDRRGDRPAPRRARRLDRPPRTPPSTSPGWPASSASTARPRAR